MASQLAAKAAMKHKVGKLGDSLGKSAGKKQEDSIDETFEDSNACAFDNAPPNFPMFLNLCYIDKEILSNRAQAVTDKSHGLFLMTNIASALNIAGNLAQKSWAYAGISVVSLTVMFFAQLALFEYSFRACYKTSRPMQQLYLPMGAVNAVVFGTFAFVNVGWFNGWMSLAADLSMPLLMLCGVESMFWTVLLFLQVHAILSMQGLRSSHTLGLAPNASPPESKTTAAAAPRDPRQAKVDEIRSRYAANNEAVLDQV